MGEGTDLKNIVLIGMPGCGKSTVGVLLAKALGIDFIDTDVVLQAREKRKLQEMINEIGVDAFLEKEQEAILALDVSRTVIATGGSVVYGDAAMQHLRRCGCIVYIRLPYEEIENRLSNLATRGVTLRDGQTLRDLYLERVALYEKYADIVFDAYGLDIETTVRELTDLINCDDGVRHGC